MKTYDLEIINTNVPRETIAFSGEEIVIKKPTSKNVAQQKFWIQKQLLSKDLEEGLRKFSNPAFLCPKPLEVSSDNYFSIEERVYGKPMNSSFVETLSDTDIDIIYNGLANFMTDFNNLRPYITQKDFLDDKKITEIITKLKKIISSKKIKVIESAIDFFNKNYQKDSSIVFSHGDMNENNIFYNPEARVLSIIDFADAKYETAQEMFYKNFSRLGWLDIERLIKSFQQINPFLNLSPDNDVSNIRTLLKNVIYSSEGLLASDIKRLDVYKRILIENIDNLDLKLSEIKTNKFKEQSDNIQKIINHNSVSGQRGRGAIGS